MGVAKAQPVGDTTFFVDESKASAYLLVAVLVPAEAQSQARRAIRTLIKPGQRRLHMKDESPARKRQILSSIAQLGVQAHVYDAGRGGRGPSSRSQREQRADCLRALVKHAGVLGVRRVVLERDATLESWDRQTLIEATRSQGLDRLQYEHRSPFEEQLLALPDAIAWSVAKGGDWKLRAQDTIEGTLMV